MDLYKLLAEEAQAEGFPAFGAVDIDLALQDPDGLFLHQVEHYDQWIKDGFAGSMEYLVRGRDRRADPRLVFPEAVSVFSVALPYSRRPVGASDSTQGPRYARYLQTGDYHESISHKLESLMKRVQSKSNQPLNWKICVDTSAVLERTWAALAGVGWIGKNNLLIHPKLGSYLFLGEVLINQPTGRKPAPIPSFCGNCTRCIQGCPTQALKERQLNSNQCISYWTLEKRGNLPITQEQKEKIGPWIAGCDICQEVCPFNIKPVRDEFLQSPKVGVSATDLQDWKTLLLETQDDYRKRIRNSAMDRIKPAQFSRNLAISLRNALLRSELDLSLAHEIQPLILARIDQESDLHAKLEWEACYYQSLRL